MAIDSPSCPGAEHSNWLPRFQPTTSLFHSFAVGCALAGAAITQQRILLTNNSKIIFNYLIVLFGLQNYANLS
jgi:hypothetical protein